MPIIDISSKLPIIGGGDHDLKPHHLYGEGDLPSCISDVEGIAVAAEDIYAMAKSK